MPKSILKFTPLLPLLLFLFAASSAAAEVSVIVVSTPGQTCGQLQQACRDSTFTGENAEQVCQQVCNTACERQGGCKDPGSPSGGGNGKPSGCQNVRGTIRISCTYRNGECSSHTCKSSSQPQVDAAPTAQRGGLLQGIKNLLGIGGQPKGPTVNVTLERTLLPRISTATVKGNQVLPGFVNDSSSQVAEVRFDVFSSDGSRAYTGEAFVKPGQQADFTFKPSLAAGDTIVATTDTQNAGFEAESKPFFLVGFPTEGSVSAELTWKLKGEDLTYGGRQLDEVTFAEGFERSNGNGWRRIFARVNGVDLLPVVFHSDAETAAAVGALEVFRVISQMFTLGLFSAEKQDVPPTSSGGSGAGAGGGGTGGQPPRSPHWRAYMDWIREERNPDSPYLACCSSLEACKIKYQTGQIAPPHTCADVGVSQWQPVGEGRCPNVSTPVRCPSPKPEWD